MNLRSLCSWMFRNPHRDRRVAERLMEEDFRKDFVSGVIDSMKEHPEEWKVMGGTATHKRGVELDCRNPNMHERATSPKQLHGVITKPTYVCMTDEEMSELGDAFDYLAKLKMLQSLRMDKR